jgi:hypothetical protein
MDDILTFDRFSELKGSEVRSADDGKIGTVNALLDPPMGWHVLEHQQPGEQQQRRCGPVEWRRPIRWRTVKRQRLLEN